MYQLLNTSFPGKNCLIIIEKYLRFAGTNLTIKTKLSLRAGGRGFSPSAMNVALN